MKRFRNIWGMGALAILIAALMLMFCGPAFGTALSADKKSEYADGQLFVFDVDDGDTIYAGAMVSANAAGYAIAGADTAATYFLGIGREYVDNSEGDDGDETVSVQRQGVFKMLLGTTITQANVGDHVYIADDQTADVAANTTNDVLCGVIVDFIDGTHAWVDIGPAVSPMVIISPYMRGIVDDADEATFKATTNLEIGTDVQAYDADLDAFALLTPTADMKTLIESTNFASMAQDLSLEIGVDTQAYDADLAAVAALTYADDQIIIGTGAGTIETTDFKATAQTAAANAVDGFVLNHRHRVTVAEINAGHELLPAISGKSYRMIQCQAIAYGGAVGTTTTVDLLGTQSAGGVKLVAYAQAGLTQSSVLVSGGTNAAVTADGASYAACDVTTAITVEKTGGDADTATGVDFILTYVIE